ncbi:MAG: (2Fe-2S)-binding protein [Candidatus Pelagadaptatus aseana]|uniref:(2Fe-2S)-binding protein n=1 Tax=Candidatus Pelagadaptatus aseana TaxID=3120508 RepID=UPI0039B24EA1
MISFQLNGQPVTTDAAPDTPLLWVIRDLFQLKGSKFGCGMGLCGACTMHLDGEAVRTCVLPIAAIAGKQITTIEGLSPEGSLHKVQQAWIDHSVAQCGYCQSGQIMSAAALLANNSNPSDSEIDQAMQGNICRCGTYPRIKQAIKDAASELNSSVSYYEPDNTPLRHSQEAIS